MSSNRYFFATLVALLLQIGTPLASYAQPADSVDSAEGDALPDGEGVDAVEAVDAVDAVEVAPEPIEAAPAPSPTVEEIPPASVEPASAQTEPVAPPEDYDSMAVEEVSDIGSGPDIEDVSLEGLLGLETDSGAEGGFGYRLRNLGIEPYIHAYIVFDAVLRGGQPFEYDIHYFNVFVGARFRDVVQAELQLEHEHGDEFGIRFAQLDLRPADWMTVRLGMFLVPFGRYNESLYPEYITFLPRGPLVMTMRSVVPVAWNEVGIQIRGEFDLCNDYHLGYAAYAVNGLEGDDPAANDSTSPGIRGMRGNFRDRNDADKAIGARIWFRRDETFEVGASVYSGAYTTDGEQRLLGVDVDGELSIGDLLVRAEWAMFQQQTVGGRFQSHGVYARAAYRVLDWLRPAVGLDYTRTRSPEFMGSDGVTLIGETRADAMQVALDVDFFPFPTTAPTVLLRVAGALRLQNDGTVGGGLAYPGNTGATLMFQAAAGF